jgi:hypothetical protein
MKVGSWVRPSEVVKVATHAARLGARQEVGGIGHEHEPHA